MAQTDWRLWGEWVKNRNCALGCPSDFNARPTHGNCRGLVGMHVTKSHFGNVSLDGIKFVTTVDFPGVLDTVNEPIKNLVTGAPHRIRIVIPEGFEHHSAEVCSARISSTGGLKFEVAQGKGSLASVVQTPHGVAA